MAIITAGLLASNVINEGSFVKATTVEQAQKNRSHANLI